MGFLTLNPAEAHVDCSDFLGVHLGHATKALEPILQNIPLDVYTKIHLSQNTEKPEQSPKNVVFLRHLESRYNHFLHTILGAGWLRGEFESMEDSPQKEQFAQHLLTRYKKEVGFDPLIDLSEKGEVQGEQLAIGMQNLFEAHPEAFFERIVVSPYRRTRKTLWYALKYLPFISQEERIILDTVLLGENLPTKTQFTIHAPNGGTIPLVLSSQVRERDYGPRQWPGFLHEYLVGLRDPLWANLNREERSHVSYFGTGLGGESQLQVEERVQTFLHQEQQNSSTNTLVVSHCQVILAAATQVFGGGFSIFKTLARHYEPKNASLNIFTPNANHLPDEPNWKCVVYNGSLWK